MASTYSQIKQLEESVGQYKADANVEWSVGKIANALIEQAKQDKPDNIVLGAIDPFEPGPNERYISGQTAGGVRAVLAQVATAVKPPPSFGLV